MGPQADSFRSGVYGRLYASSLVFVAVIGASTAGYHLLGQGRWGWLDCLYMTVITLATVGFGETLPGMDTMPEVRIFTMALILFGSGTVVYFVSNLTALIVEGDLRGALRRNRMQKRMDKLENHVILCGVGSTGVHVVEELIATQTPFVVIDHDAERLQHVVEHMGGEQVVNHVVGDATDDEVLEQAGIRRARGVVAALHDDKDNLYVTITARAANAKLRIVAKAVESTAGNKLKRAGADAVVSPMLIGGMRMVSEMVRPAVVQFLDLMLRDKDKNLRIEEVVIPAGSPLVGSALKDTDIRKATDVLVIAVRAADGSYTYNPRPDLVIEAEMTLIVLAQTPEIVKLRSGIAEGRIGKSSR